MMEQPERGTLAVGEPHPMAKSALEFVLSHSFSDLMMWMESFSSCAIESNRVGEICSETLRRVLDHEPVSDRYILGLAWMMQKGKQP